MKATTLANLERKLRPILTKLPSKTVISKYSKGRNDFLSRLKEEVPEETFNPPKELSRDLWEITFRSPIMNAAGMFKNGECYELVSKQGAGAYLGGTGTWNSRIGNEKLGISLPFCPYPKSHSASNWLGLPNDGDLINSSRARMKRINNCPIGWSLMASPDLHGEKKLKYLVEGMRLYDKAGVDFLEINESCPNVHAFKEDAKYELIGIKLRLRDIKNNFLDQRTRNLPVIVKFSNDTNQSHIPEILDLLFELNFDGVNFGNTSTDYPKKRQLIDSGEYRLYDFFTQTFGGGVSGQPLKESSLELAASAVEYKKKGMPTQEFHVIRTGGIETFDDLEQSRKAGIPLNQWFTGYFENFGKQGHDVYKNLFEPYR